MYMPFSSANMRALRFTLMPSPFSFVLTKKKPTNEPSRPDAASHMGKAMSGVEERAKVAAARIDPT
eukprot:CAMPEP_0197939644 /NCGR_PEP_ID=MMETSP1439-20131203/120009_1 /TAXON_ID=66791 /ORGANISM="Gonyaulax spinifera, Strain CCMP409" /LENGTH=65 /DNA_ID=CAMNT_0043562775 /DNA_START=1 /DNA_END=198 /DNA_ORIENTATION=-